MILIAELVTLFHWAMQEPGGMTPQKFCWRATAPHCIERG